MFKDARWKTLSLNEVEITRKSVELLSEHCHSLAFNEKIVTAMKVVLSYIEKIIQRRLPDYMYYILLPIMYTLTDLTSSLPRLVGICLKMIEIQRTIWLSNREEGIIEIFFESLEALDPAISTKIKSLIDLQFQENKVKLENFIRPFLSRLGSGFFNIETTCVIFDQFIMINTLNKMYLILALIINFLSEKLRNCEHWDDFLGIFFKEVRRITPLQLESLLERLPDSEDIESKVAIPADLKGQDYLDYVLQAQEFEEEEKKNKLHEFGELLSAKRILAEDPVLGMHQQKIMKGNLMEQALNKSKDYQKNKIKRRRTLINANMTRISAYSKDKSKPSGEHSPILNGTMDSREIVDLHGSKDMFIEENSFPKNSKNKESKNSSFQDTFLDENLKRQGLADNSLILKQNTKNSKLLNDSNQSKSLIKPMNPDSQLDKSMNKSRKSFAISEENSRDKSINQSKNEDELPDISYLEGGLLGVPDISALKPGLLDGFED